MQALALWTKVRRDLANMESLTPACTPGPMPPTLSPDHPEAPGTTELTFHVGELLPQVNRFPGLLRIHYPIQIARNLSRPPPSVNSFCDFV